MAREVSRQQVEDFLYHEAALLDEWRLDEWLALLTEDARYEVPSNDRPEADPANTLFTIADDIRRIQARITRLKDRNAHAEYPPSRTRRMIGNVRIVDQSAAELRVEANFVVYRFRREERIREYVGRYRYRLRVTDGSFKIAKREAILEALELGSLGSVSFIL
ncbi:MAG TPA: aromatic-ring-hydroxylating dioxygenase subunit beta [Alphaproteobacteria bacterium]|nr:aromatic-ring-hydroxylating dioxygenase subunit beta [Alphaproteobacteria bacterium]